MRIYLETRLQILIISLTLICPSSTHVSSSRARFGRCLNDELTALLKIITLNADTKPTSKIGSKEKASGIPRIIKLSQSPLSSNTYGRRFFFWPLRPRWWSSRYYERPFGIGTGGGMYGGIGPGGIGVHGGIGAGHYYPTNVPGFGGTPGIGVGIGGAIGAGFRPAVGIGVGAGVGAGIGALGRPVHHHQPSPPAPPPPPPENYDYNWNIGRDHYIDDYPVSNDNYEPVFPPPSNDFKPPDSGNHVGPSAVGYDGGPDHVVGYDRTSAIHHLRPPQYFAPGRFTNGVKVDPYYGSNYNGFHYRGYEPQKNSVGQIDSSKSYSYMENMDSNLNNEEKQDRRLVHDKDVKFDEMPLERQIHTDRSHIGKSALLERRSRINNNSKQLDKIKSKGNFKSDLKMKFKSNLPMDILIRKKKKSFRV